MDKKFKKTNVNLEFSNRRVFIKKHEDVERKDEIELDLQEIPFFCEWLQKEAYKTRKELQRIAESVPTLDDDDMDDW